jgi:hypothetical protein
MTLYLICIGMQPRETTKGIFTPILVQRLSIGEVSMLRLIGLVGSSQSRQTYISLSISTSLAFEATASLHSFRGIPFFMQRDSERGMIPISLDL